MACTCTEDFETIGNVTIGRNKVTCQECIDREKANDKAQRRAAKQARITEIELKNLRKLYDGEDLTAVNAERAAIRAEIQAI